MVLAYAFAIKLHNDLNSQVAHSFPYCLTCKPEQKVQEGGKRHNDCRYLLNNHIQDLHLLKRIHFPRRLMPHYY
ncbi:hypothetical protein BANRA_01806 [Escherichia coli]|nr:hypothetical protein BANRA_01806 [Escherichia coli]